MGEGDTPRITDCHDCLAQAIDALIPETEHDFSVDLIVTPDKVIQCEPQRRPAKIAAIPVLAAQAAAARRS